MRFIQTDNSLINMDLVSRYNVVEETPNRVCIFADNDKLFELQSRWEANVVLEKIAFFSNHGEGIFDPGVEDGYLASLT